MDEVPQASNISSDYEPLFSSFTKDKKFVYGVSNKLKKDLDEGKKVVPLQKKKTGQSIIKQDSLNDSSVMKQKSVNFSN